MIISAAAQRSAEQFPGYERQAEIFVRIHLDANANAPATPVVKTAVLQALETAGNPSSAHTGGDETRAMITAARDAVAELCNGLFSEEVVFTSGCTEANNLIVDSARAAGATLITSAVEHPSVLRPAEAFQADGGRLIVLPVDGTGLVKLASIEAALDRTAGPIYLSIQAANSETGVMQPVCLIAELAAKRRDVLFHCDAAQAFGKFIFPIGGARGPHVVSVSAHKLHGPMGVGALLLV